MCGVAAIYPYHYAAPPVDVAELDAIRDHMRTRGPDGAGSWIAEDARVGLAHRRLAVIDLDDRAAQPMRSACGRFHISYNGEIYNYRELKRDLEQAGVRLRTTSDTEVLLELFAREGAAAFPKLRGMFACAIWDAREQVLWLARDTYGIKPLYFADDGWTVRAASQVKALLAGGRISADPEPAGIVGFYLWGSVPEPFTLYQEIRAVPPGHVVRVDRTGAQAPEPFLRLEDIYMDARLSAPETDPEARRSAIRAAVLASVEHHLVADVPVGLFLSAGIDSAAILAAIHALDPARAAETTAITLSFAEYAGQPDDEAPLAAKIAARYGARHRIRTVDEAEFLDDLPRILEAMDQPSIDGVNNWFVAKAAAEAGLKVALSGLGGDELFGGYPSFRDMPRWRRICVLPSRIPGLGRAARGVLTALGPLLPGSSPKLPGMLEHGGTWAGAYLLHRGLYLPHELPAILDPETVARGLARLAAPMGAGLAGLLEHSPLADLPRISLMESALYMRNQLLRDVDWASMAHSLEVRTPLVDKDLLRTIRPLQEGLSSKRILGEALELPSELLDRPKTGFTTPIGKWIATGIPEFVDGGPWARSWARAVAAAAVVLSASTTETDRSQAVL